ncbi:hypothetical protein [Stygiolobus azoricus]|uniref:DUF3211 domain-containing protein n=1 Tax=Stygiolobus azoricus TaxID=41675 RepID=A0A650CP71_9CREN|nr:hypothetical protein [Stygiolobus azoricus]QGR19563.1 hypothetical protein D1868_05875 [Stygiolobus azoricus]
MYECCNRTFETLNEFKKHIKSRRVHSLTKSNVIDINLPRSIVYSIISKRDFFMRLLNLASLDNNDKYLLLLPTKKYVVGSTLKRSLAVRVEGPKSDKGLPTYVIYAGNLIYKISFKVDSIAESKTRVSLISTFEADIGRLGTLLPSVVIRKLSNLPSPGKILEEFEREIKILDLRSYGVTSK